MYDDEMGSLGLKRDWGRNGSGSQRIFGLYFMVGGVLHGRECRAGP